MIILVLKTIDSSNEQKLFDNINNKDIYKDIIDIAVQCINYRNNDVFINLFYNFEDNKLTKTGQVGKTFYICNIEFSELLSNSKYNIDLFEYTDDLYIYELVGKNIMNDLSVFIKDCVSDLNEAYTKFITYNDSSKELYYLVNGFKNTDYFTQNDYENAFSMIIKESYTYRCYKDVKSYNFLDKEMIKSFKSLKTIPISFNNKVDDFISKLLNCQNNQISFSKYYLKICCLDNDGFINEIKKVFKEKDIDNISEYLIILSNRSKASGDNIFVNVIKELIDADISLISFILENNVSITNITEVDKIY